MTKQPTPGLHENFAEEAAMTDKAMVTDAMVKRAATEFLSHKGERPYRVTRRGAELWEDYAPAMQAALEAALAQAEQPVAWQPIDTAPKGEVTEDAGCRGVSEWFFGRVSKEFRKNGAAPFVVIRRRAWPQEDSWECNGEAHYVPRYFDAWMPLALSPSKIEAGENTAETAAPPVQHLEVNREAIDAWLTANCGVGIPYNEATDVKTMLHGLAYILRQIESTNTYKVNIGQVGPATSALRMALDHFAVAALSGSPAPVSTESVSDTPSAALEASHE